MKIFAIGASKNIGYFTTLREHPSRFFEVLYSLISLITDLLEAGHTVVYLMRSPKAFEADETIQGYVKQGKVIVAKGDALNKEQVQAAWDTANQDGRVELVLFSVGMYSSSHMMILKDLINLFRRNAYIPLDKRIGH
jgi:hypothetical protein